jgi:chromosome segregation ATPase
MRDELTVKVLSQTSENIQKLFDLTTRIDERVKIIQSNQEEINHRVRECTDDYKEILERTVKLEATCGMKLNEENTNSDQIVGIDKRIVHLEHNSQGAENRWNRIFTFAIQLVWVVLASWVLYKLHLNPPNLP